MDNLENTDDRQQDVARLTLEQAEAVRLGRKIREQQQRRAMLPAYAATKVFEVLYLGDSRCRKVTRETTTLQAIWDSKFLIVLWLALTVWLAGPMWAGGRLSWSTAAALVAVTATLVTVISFYKFALDRLQGELIKDLAALQSVLGEDPLKWVNDIHDRDDLTGFIDTKLSTELREETRNVRDRRSLTTMSKTRLRGRFGMKFPQTEAILKAGHR